MRKVFLFTLQLLALTALSQAPRLINYQGALRDVNSVALANRSFSIRFQLQQGSNVVLTEEQQLTTNALGLFSTQIGKVNTTQMAAVNFSAADLFLLVGIDTTGGSNFITLGTPQQLVSVPFSMYALTVPSSYSNSILQIGDKSYSLAQPIPTLALNGNSLSVSNGNTVVLDSYVAGNGINITGGPEYTLSAIPAATTLQATSAGIASVTTSGSDFTVSVPAPALTSTGNTVTLNQGTVVTSATVGVIQPTLTASGNTITLLQGTNPATAVLAPSNITVTTSGSLATVSTPTAGTNFNINVITPTISLTANANSLAIGPAGNTIALPGYSLATNSNSITLLRNGTPLANVQVPAGNLTLSGTGILSNTLSAGGNSVVLNTYTTGTGITLSGAGPVYTLSSTPGLTLSGAANNNLTSGSNTVTLNTYTVSGNGLSLTGGPQYTIVSSILTPSIRGAGIASVNPLFGSNFTVTVPPPSLTYGSNSLTINQGTASSGVLIVPSLTLGGTGNNSLTAGGNTVALNTYTVSGNGLSLTGGPNYTIVSSIQTPSMRAAGIASVNPASGNSFTVSVPPPSLSFGSNSLTITQGTASSGVQILPTLTLTGANNNSLTAGNNTVALNTYAVSGNGLSLIGGPQYTIVSSIQTPSITGTGVAAVNPASGSNFTVNVPPPTLAFGSNSLTISQGTASAGVQILPTLTLTGLNNNNLTAGSNTVVLNNYSAGQGIVIGGISPNFSISAINSGSNAVWGTNGNALTLPTVNFLGTSDAVDLVFRTNNQPRITLNALTGSMDFVNDQSSITFPATTGLPGPMINMFASGTSNSTRMVIQHSPPWPSYGLQYEDLTDKFIFIGNTQTIQTIDLTNARVGIRTSNPSTPLHVNGMVRIVDGTQGADKVLTSDANGNAKWARSARNTGFHVASSLSQTVANGVWTQVNFNSEDFDHGADFASNQFVAPDSGAYHFDITISWSPMANSTGWTHTALYVNGFAVKYQMSATSTGYFSNSLSTLLFLPAGAVVTVRVLQQQGVVEAIYSSGNDYTHFSGYRVY